LCGTNYKYFLVSLVIEMMYLHLCVCGNVLLVHHYLNQMDLFMHKPYVFPCIYFEVAVSVCMYSYIDTLQQMLTHCKTCRHTATHCNTLQRSGSPIKKVWSEPCTSICLNAKVLSVRKYYKCLLYTTTTLIHVYCLPACV